MKRKGPVNSTVGASLRQHIMRAGILLPLMVVILTPGKSDACTVTTTADFGAGSLRECINYANANPGDTISFDISPADSGYVTSGPDSWWRISPNSPLPSITAASIIIDGSTQTANRGDTNSRGPDIEINGSGAGVTDGLVMNGGSGTVRSLAVNRFRDDGIVLSTGDGNVVESCYIGLDPTGTVDLGNTDHGIIIRDGSNNNTIGGPGAGNVISGNVDRGVRILSTSGNVIQGNLIGTDPTGTTDLGNSAWGVHLEGASGNFIGGQNAGEGNIIAHNNLDGIYITGSGADQNLVSGNTIYSNGGLGIDLAPNGVGVGFSANDGKTAPVFTSLTNSGPDLAVEILGDPGDVVEFFRVNNAAAPAVGEDPTGSGEGYLYLGACVDDGVCSGPYMVSGADNDPAAGTVSAILSGIILTSTDILTATATDPSNNTSEFAASNVVVSSCPTVIFTGDSGLGSLRDCIAYANANPGTTIDFDIPDTSPGYVTSGADSWWRIIPDDRLPDITAAGTVIDGTTQTVNRGNTNTMGPEIEIAGLNAGNNIDGLTLTGGDGTVRGLVINQFDSDGIYLSLLDGYVVERCYLGLDPTGTSVLANRDSGIDIGGGSNNNTIGGPGEGNVIGGNGASGINLTSDGNVIQGNFIGTDTSGTIDLGNTDHGILLSGAFGNTIGGQDAAESNIIAFNGEDGLYVTGGGAVQNLILANSIFSNTGLGIDLAPTGVGVGPTANNGKTAPVITGIAGTGVNPVVGVTTDPGDTVQFYRVGNTAGPAVLPDASGSGEGFYYLGACIDNGACSGPSMFSVSDGDPAAGSVSATIEGAVLTVDDAFTATATDASENTSEFGANVTVSSCPTVIYTADAGTSSLRECINYANANPGTTITFDIPNTDPGYVTAGADSWWEISPGSELPFLTASGTVIDGATQTTNRGDTNSLGPEIALAGSLAGGASYGLVVDNPGGGSTIRGLSIGNFSLSGIWLNAGTNTVIGNYVGLEPDGTTIAGNNTSSTALVGGIRVTSADNTIGGTTAAERNVISGNVLAGLVITGAGATGNQVLGNYIGLDSGGTLDRGNVNDGEGIEIDLASTNTIGGAAPGAGNVISGNESDGIEIDGADLNVVQGNYIGTDSTGTLVVPNDRDGIDINSNGADGATDNLIGGTAAGTGNLIRGNNINGVEIRDETVVGSTTGNSVQGNSIFDNGQLGIDLVPTGVTANDGGDGDTGPNGLQNYPLLTSVVSNGVSTTITGTLNSAPNTTFRLEFFASTAADPSGFGEGETFLGAADVTTDGAGDAPFSVNLPTAVSPGDYVTATATGPTGSTSEFAANTVIPLTLVKQAFLASDGSLLSNSTTLPRGTALRFLIYIDNTGPGHTDVSVQDVLDPAFAYSTGSLKVDNSLSSGASPGDIYSAVSAATPLTDVIDADVASVTGATINVGDRFAANGQLDIDGNRVWALLFTVRMQ